MSALIKKDDLRAEGFKQAIADVLPKHCTADRMAKVAILALSKTPKLQDCTKASFLECMMTCSELGIEPDGRRAHLIPYGKTCTLIIDYKGLAELAMRSGVVSNIHADVVCDNDVFEYDLGQIQKHRIDFKKGRGDVYAVYAVVTFKDGTKKAEVMTLQEVEAIRKRSRAGSSGPWVTDFNEMAKKTVFRRLAKWLPLSPEYRDALERDADTFEEMKRAQATTQHQIALEMKEAERAVEEDAGMQFAAQAKEDADAESDPDDDLDYGDEKKEGEV